MSEKIIIVGAGGHAKVCIELLREMGEEIAYCVGETDSGHSCMGVPVLCGDSNLSQLRSKGFHRAFIAVGSNQARYKLATLSIQHGFHLVNAISPHAVISPSASLGQGVAIMAGVIINAKSVVMDLAIINTGAVIDHDCYIGKAAHIAPRCALTGNVKVGDFAFLGAGCVVIPEIVISENVTLGAGAVVINELPAGARAVGVPAHILK